ncbi:hypothetical protein CAPTEDRAFT_224672 [Capitella teleta]|nr:hypothetical protein CAPTEDRAFT_224672 [Capitella teleta]|eukprot:ELT98414.1 hypothetical protein CAPTEDRAFT_224672 [Capitella teleta]
MQEASNLKDRASDLIETTISSKKTYPAPSIPKTPSRTINQMLSTRCDHTFNNPGKAALAYMVCGVFTGITFIYNQIMTRTGQQSTASHRMWCISCGVVSLGIVLFCTLTYQLIMALSFVLHGMLYYSAMLVAVAGIGLGVSGIVFFDKDGQSTATGKIGEKASAVYDSVRQRSTHQD